MKSATARGWLAGMGDKDFGIGIFMPGMKDSVISRFLGNGKTCPTGSTCSYVAPVQTLKLTKGGAVDYKFHFTIGTLDEIRSRFVKLR